MSISDFPATHFEDRRAAIRHRTRGRTRFSRSARWQEGFLNDISDGGAQIVTTDPVVPGEKTVVLLENYKKNATVAIKGIVVWQNLDRIIAKKEKPVFRMGIRFDEALPCGAENFLTPIKR